MQGRKNLHDANAWWIKSNSVFIFGCESWSWSQQALNMIKWWETQMMRRFFGFQRKGRSNVGRVLYEDRKGRKEETRNTFPVGRHR